LTCHRAGHSGRLYDIGPGVFIKGKELFTKSLWYYQTGSCFAELFTSNPCVTCVLR